MAFSRLCIFKMACLVSRFHLSLEPFVYLFDYIRMDVRNSIYRIHDNSINGLDRSSFSQKRCANYFDCWYVALLFVHEKNSEYRI